MTTFPDHFHPIHLGRCESTNDYIKTNFARLEKHLPLMVSAVSQCGGRGRDGRNWFSVENLGIYATFAFALTGKRGLPLLSIVSGIAVAEMLENWTGGEFVLKWPNDILSGGRKVAGILCENMIAGEVITSLVGIGVNVNHREEDFPAELRARAGSLYLLTGRDWPVGEGRDRLAAALASWLGKLADGRSGEILARARHLSRSFLGQTVSFHRQGHVLRGTFVDIAPDGGLLLGLPGDEKKIFYSGELD